MAGVFSYPNLTIYADGVSYGKTLVIGTKDAFAVHFIVNNAAKLFLPTSGNLVVSPNGNPAPSVTNTRTAGLSVWCASNDRYATFINENQSAGNGMRVMAATNKGSIGAWGFPTSGNNIGAFCFGGANNTTSSYNEAASIDCFAGSDWTNTSRETRITIGVTPSGSTTITTALAIASDGTLTASTGDTVIATAGKTLKIKEGANAKMGVSTLVAGTVTVSTTAVTANSRILLTHQNAGGTVGELSIGTVTAGTSFVINSSSATDTSNILWVILEPS